MYSSNVIKNIHFVSEKLQNYEPPTICIPSPFPPVCYATTHFIFNSFGKGNLFEILTHRKEIIVTYSKVVPFIHISTYLYFRESLGIPSFLRKTPSRTHCTVQEYSY